MSRPEFAPHEAYALPLPAAPLPIVIVGAGGIVRDAHLPAYRQAGFPVAALVDRIPEKAEALAADFDVPLVFDSLGDAAARFGTGAVYDVALMSDQFPAALRALPEGAAVLLQKPLGLTLAETAELQRIVRERRLIAAVNTQLRFAPYVAEARRLIAAGEIGELIDIEIRVIVETHWELFPYVFALERMEMPLHSVHYVDLVRSFVGDPSSVSAVTVPHPGKPLASTRSAYILHYEGRPLRVTVLTNHDHDFGPEHQSSSIVWQGTTGAIRAQMGLLLDYPRGGVDRLQRAAPGGPWVDVPFAGTWFPDAFIGSMATVQRRATGEADSMPTSVDDVARTMAVLEAAHEAQARGGVPLPRTERSTPCERIES